MLRVENRPQGAEDVRGVYGILTKICGPFNRMLASANRVTYNSGQLHYSSNQPHGRPCAGRKRNGHQTTTLRLNRSHRRAAWAECLRATKPLDTNDFQGRSA